jgi:hypothetical protein
MEDYFTDLPFELQGEILKYTSNYPHISKKTYNPNLYYQQYCKQSIKKQEFINYVNIYNPKNFIIYTNAFNHVNMPEFLTYIISENIVTTVALTIYMTEYMTKYRVEVNYYRNYYEDIYSFMNEINYNDIYYDIFTTYNILNLRECQKIYSKYSKQYTIDIINEKTPGINVNDMYSFYELCKKLIYLHSNETLLYDNKQTVLFYDTTFVTFDVTGEIINENIDKIFDNIQVMINHYAPYKQKMIEIIKNKNF